MSLELTKEDALARISELALQDKRTLIGIVGKPGGGKSTLSKYLLKNSDPALVCVVPMDGFHLSNKVLKSQAKADRKGAPDTFDVQGFAELIRRIKSEATTAIYYPIFDRSIEESIAAQGVVLPKTRVVIIEGNYLLHNAGGWQEIAPLLDQSWYAYLDENVRISRLIARHISHGRDPEAAKEWAKGTDQRNAELIEATVELADFRIHP
jgi:pantothenate kinase